MITEEQRRALFALREALHLCEAAGVLIQARESHIGDEHQQEITVGDNWHYTRESFLRAENVDAVLAEHPES
ncbi:hypothetical protein D3C81_773740 [compost metagenome]